MYQPTMFSISVLSSGDYLFWMSPNEVILRLMPVRKPLLAANTRPELTWVSPAHVIR